MKTSPKKRPLLRWYKMGREEIVDIFGEESAFLGVLDGVYNAWILFGRVPATSLNYKKMVTAGAELKIH